MKQETSPIQRIFRWILRITVGLIALAIVTVAGAWTWRQTLVWEAKNARPKIDKSAGVDELFVTEIGGIPQWIHSRGTNKNNPVILYLHGGPGTPMIPFEHLFQNEWEDDFIVVHWDQRGAGKTRRASNAKEIDKTVSFDRMLSDALQVTQFVKERYDKDKIAVLGHSWGTMLGDALVTAHPQHFSVYAGTGVAVNITANEIEGYRKALEIARERYDEKAIAELESIAPYPELDGETRSEKTSILRKYQNKFRIGLTARPDLDPETIIVMGMLASPEYSLLDIISVAKDDHDWPQLDRAVDNFDAYRDGVKFQMPVVYLLGRRDWQTPSTLAAAFFDDIEAPEKHLVWLENSAHAPNVDEPHKFAEAMKEFVWPIANENQ